MASESLAASSSSNFAPYKEENSPDSDVDLTDCLLKHMDISITETEKRTSTGLNLRDRYTVYLINIKVTDNLWNISDKGLGQLWRRYSDFEHLRYYLSVEYPWAVIPPLPEKKHTFPAHNAPSDTFDPDFIDRRRAGLENFLHRLAYHPVISLDSVFLMFLQDETAWREAIKSKGFLKFAEDKIRMFSAVTRIKDADPKFQIIKKNNNDLQVAITNIIKSRAKIACRIYNIHKLHSNYGKLFSEWSGLEKEMGDSLQRAGHYFDSIFSVIGSSLWEEEQLVDQIKEYLYYCWSIDEVCNRRDVIQYQIDQCNMMISNKHIEKERLLQGKAGMVSRLFGSLETVDDRVAKIDDIEQKIKDSEESVKTFTDSMGEFGIKAISDIERFKKQKVKDLTETVENYIKHQMLATKKNLQAWMNIKECMDSLPT